MSNHLRIRIRNFLFEHFHKYKLKRICQAIGIKPYPWQSSFALGRTNKLDGDLGRATGKTMAVMLRVLMMHHTDPVFPWMFYLDPDWKPYDSHRKMWYYREYIRLSQKCKHAGIPVPEMYVDVGWTIHI